MLDNLKQKMIDIGIQNILQAASKNLDIDSRLKESNLTRDKVIEMLNKYRNTSEGQYIINKYNMPIDAMINILSNNSSSNNNTNQAFNGQRKKFPDLEKYNV